MDILFATDLHGHKERYRLLGDRIRSLNPDLAILGADILPHGNMFRETIDTQKDFLNNYLSDFLKSLKCEVIIDFGNDDLRCLWMPFKEMIDDINNVHYSHMNSIVIGKYQFIGMHYVPDYPFTRKDWCRKDNADWIVDPIQLGPPFLEFKDGPETIDDLEAYYNYENSIEDILNNHNEFHKPMDNKKQVYLFHSPPRMAGLDVCADKRQVGSRSITQFILDNNPYCVLSGHIHESPDMTGIFMNKIGDTICIQPGQRYQDDEANYVIMNLDDIERTIERHCVQSGQGGE